MEFAWGDELGDESQGLDILGVRGLDQSLEAKLVNGITTVSLRGRYFTVVPWAIGEFFSADVAAHAAEFDESHFRRFLARIEFLVLACTTVDDGDGDPGGALGRLIFQTEMAALSRGDPIPFPSDRSGSMLGTYFGPCRALGLLRSGDAGSGQPFVVTPRGQAIWQARNQALEDGTWRSLLWEAERLSPADARALVPHFSLKNLAAAADEAAALRTALLEPWTPAGSAAASVAQAYERFDQTIQWVRSHNHEAALSADALLSIAWRRAAFGGNSELPVEMSWAEYEWRRRLHYARELLLSAVSDTVKVLKSASIDEVIGDWQAEPDLPPRLTMCWPEAALSGTRCGAEAVSSVPVDLFADGAPPDDLARLRPYPRALAAFAIVAALASQSGRLRTSGAFQDYRAPGEAALKCVETAGDEPFLDALQSLAEVAVRAHLATTFRKMGGGQKCSLRFFPEGPRLISTGLATGAGRSGSRLANVIKILEDAAVPAIGFDG